MSNENLHFNDMSPEDRRDHLKKAFSILAEALKAVGFDKVEKQDSPLIKIGTTHLNNDLH